MSTTGRLDLEVNFTQVVSNGFNPMVSTVVTDSLKLDISKALGHELISIDSCIDERGLGITQIWEELSDRGVISYTSQNLFAVKDKTISAATLC